MVVVRVFTGELLGGLDAESILHPLSFGSVVDQPVNRTAVVLIDSRLFVCDLVALDCDDFGLWRPGNFEFAGRRNGVPGAGGFLSRIR